MEPVLMPYISCGQRHPSTAQAHSHCHLCEALHAKTFMMIAKAHMDSERRAAVLVTSFFTRYVSLSFHPRFHSPGTPTWSICISACHACTASQCDLWDPGWRDPGFRHCDFFALAPIGPSGNFFCFLSCSFQRTARYEAHKWACHTTHRDCYDASIPLISAWWLLFRLFLFACFCGCVCFICLRVLFTLFLL